MFELRGLIRESEGFLLQVVSYIHLSQTSEIISELMWDFQVNLYV